MSEQTVQDLMQKHLLESSSDENEMLQILEFTQANGVPLTNDQALGMLLLHEHDMDDLGNYIMNIRSKMTPMTKHLDVINKLTLADRIKGNAKLANILKANANPANAQVPQTGAQMK